MLSCEGSAKVGPDAEARRIKSVLFQVSISRKDEGISQPQMAEATWIARPGKCQNRINRRVNAGLKQLHRW
jgi:hypothetical protein